MSASDRSSYYHNLALFLYPAHVHFSSIGRSDVCVVCTLTSANALFDILVSGSFLSQRIMWDSHNSFGTQFRWLLL